MFEVEYLERLGQEGWKQGQCHLALDTPINFAYNPRLIFGALFSAWF